MKRLNNAAQLLATLFLVVSSMPAWAGADAEVVLGTGPDDYRSREAAAWIDLFSLPLSLDARHFVARNSGGHLAEENRLGLSWGVNDWLLASYHKKKTRGEVFDIRTEEYAADLTVSRLWQGKLETTLSFLYGSSTFEPNARPVVAAFIAPLLPKAEKYSYGLDQALSDQWSLSIAYEEYRYSKDPVTLAQFLLRRLKRPNNGTFELISFPDHMVSLGLRWQPAEAWSFGFSGARTMTVVNQTLDSLRLEGSYRFNKTFQMGAALTRSTSSELKRNDGTTLVEGAGGNYFELSGRLSFD